MRTNIRIEVTQDHIDRGSQSDPWACPIALALRDAYPGRTIRVETEEIYATDRDGYEVLIRLPLEAQNFIHKFDSKLDREHSQPFTLWLQVPELFLPSPLDDGASQVFFS
jgi:hypothetical protein